MEGKAELHPGRRAASGPPGQEPKPTGVSDRGPDVQLAEASAGGGVLRPQPALLPCQQLHCVREERAAAGAGGQAAARARRRERARRGGCEAAPAVALRPLPATLPWRRARRPAAAGCRSGKGFGGDKGLKPRHWGIPGASERRRSCGGANCAAALAPERCGHAGGEASGRPEGRAPPTSPGEPLALGSHRASLPQPRWTSRSSPAYPSSAQTFPTPSPGRVAGSAGAAL
ncbi:uncharacterized protein ENSP00000471857-like [Cavia porcellus]|uniref:uncharacterized protein ENSP00000471857-like n=1 Tax=Cavia porcellus TaxID=10141 RepID=UPI002FE371AD